MTETEEKKPEMRKLAKEGLETSGPKEKKPKKDPPPE